MSANTELETSAIAQAAIAAAKAIVPFTLQEWLTFRLGEEEYGIDILRVQEIRSCEKPTRIANIPAFIKGVVNLRGVIVRSSRNSPSSPQKASRPSQGRH
jgi:purine-binding chemotaxis protein CheW